MRAVASGSIKRSGLSRAQASEYVSGYSTKNLPEKSHERVAKRMKSQKQKNARSRTY